MHVFQGCITYSLSWGHSHGLTLRPRRVSIPVPVDGTGSGTHAGNLQSKAFLQSFPLYTIVDVSYAARTTLFKCVDAAQAHMPTMLHCLHDAPLCHLAIAKHVPSAMCTPAPHFPHRDAPQCNYAAHACTMRAPYASHSTRDTVLMMCRSGAVPYCHPCSPCTMRHAHLTSGGLELQRCLQRCLLCDAAIHRLSLFIFGVSTEGTSSTACLLRCFRKHASNAAAPRAFRCIGDISSISPQIKKCYALKGQNCALHEYALLVCLGLHLRARACSARTAQWRARRSEFDAQCKRIRCSVILP